MTTQLGPDREIQKRTYQLGPDHDIQKRKVGEKGKDPLSTARTLLTKVTVTMSPLQAQLWWSGPINDWYESSFVAPQLPANLLGLPISLSPGIHKDFPHACITACHQRQALPSALQGGRMHSRALCCTKQNATWSRAANRADSRGVTKATATPAFPARAVLPQRCTYISAEAGSW